MRVKSPAFKNLRVRLDLVLKLIDELNSARGAVLKEDASGE